MATRASRLLASAAVAFAAVAVALLIQPPAPVAAANPTFTSISPTVGSSSGGTAVTIIGTGFLPGAIVYIGGSAASNVTVVSATQITATTPVGTQGSANVLIVNTDGGAVTQTAAFFFTAGTTTLSLGFVDPPSGAVGGGALVTVVGTGFQSGLTVTFGGVASTSVTMLSSTSLLVRTPAGPSGTVPVTVTNPDGGAATLPSGYTYGTPAPFSVRGVTPATGPTSGGTVVTITGSGFLTGSTVRFGSASATNVQFVSSTQLNATTPPGTAATVSVQVISAANESATLSNAFTYTGSAAPTSTVTPSTGGPVAVSGVTPNIGPSAGGTVVTITGNGFASGAAVLFGLLPASNVTVNGPSQITATAPANTVAVGPVSVTVVNPGGASGALSSAFTYGASTGALNVTSLSPISGSVNGGTVVTINGTGLTAVTGVQFGGVSGSSLTIISDTRATVVTPARGAGPVPVTIIAGGSSTTIPNGFVFSTTPSISLASISPSTGVTSGGTTVTLTGAGFVSGMTVAFGGTMSSSVVVTSPTQATVTVPSRTSAGTVDVTAGLPSGDTASLPNGFTYQAGGSISAPLPAQGFQLFVFSGGTNQQLVMAANCSGNASAFWATDAAGQFVVYVPGTSIAAVNATWNSMFPAGLPASTPLIGKCS